MGMAVWAVKLKTHKKKQYVNKKKKNPFEGKNNSDH